MRLTDKLNLRRRATLVLLCAGALALAVPGIYLISRSHPRRNYTFQQRGSYDFTDYRNGDGAGPKVGERIDLQHFAGPDGKKLTEAVGADIFMLATIDPDCGASWVARDELHDVSAHIAEANVPYVLVSATTSRPADEFFKYAGSLGVNAPAFMWQRSEATPPETLLTMVVPSHILVRRDGTILQTWPGTRKGRKIRFQMVNQIIADTLQIASNRP